MRQARTVLGPLDGAYAEFTRRLSESNIRSRLALIAYEAASDRFSATAFLSSSPVAVDLEKDVPYTIAAGGANITREEVQDARMACLNDQLCYLVASAYEAYEEFVKALYAVLVYFDPSAWGVKDCQAAGKGLTISQLRRKTFKWTVKWVREHHHSGVSRILPQLRLCLPLLLRERPDVNPMRLDYRLLMVMIEQLRHCIVHCHGRVPDMGAFCDKIAKKAGITRGGVARLSRGQEGRVARYLGPPAGSEKRVLLAEWSRDERGNLQKRGFDELLEYIASHACLLCAGLAARCGVRPQWDPYLVMRGESVYHLSSCEYADSRIGVTHRLAREVCHLTRHECSAKGSKVMYKRE